jgi:hypothetical protein
MLDNTEKDFKNKDTESNNIDIDSNIATKKSQVEKPKNESRISKMRFSRRARASPIDEGDEDVNDFINSLIKRVDNNLK